MGRVRVAIYWARTREEKLYAPVCIKMFDAMWVRLSSVLEQGLSFFVVPQTVVAERHLGERWRDRQTQHVYGCIVRVRVGVRVRIRVRVMVRERVR